MKIDCKNITICWVCFMNLRISEPVSDIYGLLIFQINKLYSDQNVSNISENCDINSVVCFIINFRRYATIYCVTLHLKWKMSNFSESCLNSSGWNPKWEIPMLYKSIQSACWFKLQEAAPDMDRSISHLLFDRSQKCACSVCEIGLQICSPFTAHWPLWHLQRRRGWCLRLKSECCVNK